VTVGQLLTTAAAAERLELSVRTLEKWRYERRGPTYRRMGRTVRYDTDDLDRWLAAQTVNPEARLAGD
jgi:excisionase family DNA binding protein